MQKISLKKFSILVYFFASHLIYTYCKAKLVSRTSLGAVIAGVTAVVVWCNNSAGLIMGATVNNLRLVDKHGGYQGVDLYRYKDKFLYTL